MPKPNVNQSSSVSAFEPNAANRSSSVSTFILGTRTPPQEPHQWNVHFDTLFGDVANANNENIPGIHCSHFFEQFFDF